MSGSLIYRDLFNETTISDLDFMNINDLTINEALDVTNATITGFPVDDTNISFVNNEVTLKDDISSNTLKLGATRTDNVVATGTTLHLQNTGDSAIFIEGDSDNISETDNGIVHYSQDGGILYYRIGTTSDNSMSFKGYDAVGGTFNSFRFYTGGQITTNTGQLPTITQEPTLRVTIDDSYKIVRIKTNEITSFSGPNVDITGILFEAADMTQVGSINGTDFDTLVSDVSQNATDIATNTAAIDEIENVILDSHTLQLKDPASILVGSRIEFDYTTNRINFQLLDGTYQTFMYLTNNGGEGELDVAIINNSAGSVTIENVPINNGLVDGVDVAALNSTVSTNTSNISTNTSSIATLNGYVNQDVRTNADDVAFGADFHFDSAIVGANKVSSTTDADLVIQSSNYATLYIEADTNNNNESEVSKLWMSIDGKLNCALFGIEETNNATHISTFNTTGSAGMFRIKTGGIIDGVTTAGLVPVIDTDATSRFEIDASGVVSVLNQLEVNTINEYSSGSGVTVDGLLIKDGGISYTAIGTDPVFTTVTLTNKVNTDLIQERSANNGVEIDGVTCKDGDVIISSGILDYDFSTYSPTYTNVSNTSSISNTYSRYRQIGNQVDYTITFAATVGLPGSGSLRISLPVSSNFTQKYHVFGTGQEIDAVSASLRVQADTANDELLVNFVNATSASSRTYMVSGNYVVL